jgi:benzoyl-CoA reductase/2-hydroxyglutaryl-CoA dehydratase subunit BcrC/BadD/HgdB
MRCVLKKVGFTTSIPVEILFSAGFVPIDLNNIFITDSNPAGLVEKAENEGFPRNTCAWIKGIFSTIQKRNDIDTIISVVEGDCSNTRALKEVLEMKGVRCVPFSYPNSGNYNDIKNQIEILCGYFGIKITDCNETKKKLDSVREKLGHLDSLTWKENKATGFENHIWQVSSSDFNSDFNEFDKKLSAAINEIKKREAKREKIRLGYIGVPPINSDIYDFIETCDARVVYNEVQRQFTMIDAVGNPDIVEVYRQFTYPYSLDGRLADIKKNIELREIDGIIHYAQAFCFRGIEDIVIRNELAVPVLTLEGDGPGEIDARTKLRIESFIDMLKD